MIGLKKYEKNNKIEKLMYKEKWSVLTLDYNADQRKKVGDGEIL